MRYKKNQMGLLDREGNTLSCSMGLDWPPIEVVAYGSSEEAKEHVTDPDMQRIAVWEKLCGLRKMDISKCLSCKFVLQEGEYLNQNPQGRRGISQKIRSPGFSGPNKHTPLKNPPKPKR